MKIKKDVIWDVLNNIDLKGSINFDDERYTDLSEGREFFNFNKLKRNLGIINGELRNPVKQTLNLFCGHMGSGKSTELSNFSNQLDKDNFFMVINIDANKKLNLISLEFVDVFVLVAKELFEKAKLIKLEIDPIYLQGLYDWFQSKVLISKKSTDYKINITSGAKASTGLLDILLKIFTKLKSSIEISDSESESIRKDVKNSFTDFAKLFNRLLNHIKEKLENRKEILFVIDGLDKLYEREINKKIFIDNYHNFLLIDGNFIFTVNIDVIYSDNSISNKYRTEILPMIKLHNQDGSKNEKSYESLKVFISKIMDLELFENKDDIEKIIYFSGGNPRQLLRILNQSILNNKSEEEDAKLETEAIKKGIYDLKQEFMIFMRDEQYKEAINVDNIEKKGKYTKNPLRIEMLHNLIILQYNNFFWRTNPLVRDIGKYKELKNGSN
jgi:hypothetical protein